MSLTVKDIKEAKSDEHLFKMLSSELQRCLPEQVQNDLGTLVQALRGLPRGLRAMAATYRLDVSMAMNDLGWHFFNNHNLEFSEEIQSGLHELEATEAADIFEKAKALIQPHWNQIGQLTAKTFADWYESSGLAAALSPLNKQMWKICSESKDYGIMSYWLIYARKHPEQVLKN
jgi:hypothetical protein